MAKLRKMLGDVNDQVCVDLMHLIETQSKETLALWALSYIKEYTKIYTSSCLNQTMDMVNRCLKNEVTIKDIKPYLKEARKDAASLNEPSSVAASKAIATACAVLVTPSNALGFLFYGAAAVAYHEAGVHAEQIVYDTYGRKEFLKAFKSLRQVAIEDEAHPVNIKWNC